MYWCRKDADFAVKARHEDCVRKTAVEAMVKARFVEEGAAREAVDRVFGRCYKDMEPFGRRAKCVSRLFFFLKKSQFLELFAYF